MNIWAEAIFLTFMGITFVFSFLIILIFSISILKRIAPRFDRLLVAGNSNTSNVQTIEDSSVLKKKVAAAAFAIHKLQNNKLK